MVEGLTQQEQLIKDIQYEKQKRRRQVEEQFAPIESQLQGYYSQIAEQQQLIGQKRQEAQQQRAKALAYKIPQRSISQQFALGSNVFGIERKVPIVRKQRRQALTQISSFESQLGTAEQELETQRSRLQQEEERIRKEKEYALRLANQVGYTVTPAPVTTTEISGTTQSVIFGTSELGTITQPIISKSTTTTTTPPTTSTVTPTTSKYPKTGLEYLGTKLVGLFKKKKPTKIPETPEITELRNELISGGLTAETIPSGYYGISTTESPTGEALVNINTGEMFIPKGTNISVSQFLGQTPQIQSQTFKTQFAPLPTVTPIISDEGRGGKKVINVISGFVKSPSKLNVSNLNLFGFGGEKRVIDVLKGVVKSPTREEIIQTEQQKQLETKFQSLTGEELLTLSKIGGSGVTVGETTELGTEFIFQPTESQIKESRKTALSEYEKLPLGERAKARASEYSLIVPRLGIGLAEFGVGFTASGFGSSVTFKETDEGLKSYSTFDIGKEVIGKIPYVEEIKSRKVGKTAEVIETGASIIIPTGLLAKEYSLLRTSGLTKLEAGGELARSLTGVQFKGRRFIAEDIINFDKSFEYSTPSGSFEIVKGKGLGGTEIVGYQVTGKPTVDIGGVKVTPTKDITVGGVISKTPFIEIRGGKIIEGYQLDVGGFGAKPKGEPFTSGAIFGKTGFEFPETQRFTTLQQNFGSFDVTSEGITGGFKQGKLIKGTGISGERQITKIEKGRVKYEDLITSGTSKLDVFVSGGRRRAISFIESARPSSELTKLSKERKKISKEFLEGGFVPETIGTKKRITVGEIFGEGEFDVGQTILKTTTKKKKITPSLSQQVKDVLKIKETKPTPPKILESKIKPSEVIPSQILKETPSPYAGTGLYERTENIMIQPTTNTFGGQKIGLKEQEGLITAPFIKPLYSQIEKERFISGVSQLPITSQNLLPSQREITGQRNIIGTSLETSQKQETTKPTTRTTQKPTSSRQRLLGIPPLGLPRLKRSISRGQRKKQPTKYIPSLTGAIRFNVLKETITPRQLKKTKGFPTIRGVVGKGVTLKLRKRKGLKRKKK